MKYSGLLQLLVTDLTPEALIWILDFSYGRFFQDTLMEFLQ